MGRGSPRGTKYLSVWVHLTTKCTEPILVEVPWVVKVCETAKQSEIMMCMELYTLSESRDGNNLSPSFRNCETKYQLIRERFKAHLFHCFDTYFLH